MLFDSHAHYDDERFDEDRAKLLSRVHDSGVNRIVNVASDVESSRFSIKLSEDYDFIYASVGVHPHVAETMNDGTIDELRELSKHKKVVAIGEIGLDYYWDRSFVELQKEVFIKHKFIDCFFLFN